MSWRRTVGNLLEYIRWRGDIPFSVIPPCEVDELIFSHLAYLDLDGIVGKQPVKLSQAYVLWKQKGYSAPKGIHSRFIWDEIIPMFGEAAGTRRFCDCLFSDFISVCDEVKQSQFGAVTITLPGIRGEHILFRGTDDTLIGWKENLCMSYLSAVPAQTAALEYLCRHEKNGELTLCGHSKGGNLAVFAAGAASSEVQENILCVWNFDGPGFRQDFLRSDGYRRVAGKIRTYVPESSVFGMMLANDGRYRVVRSSAAGVAQHDGFSWEISGSGFCRAKALSEKSRLHHRIMERWLAGIPDDCRAALVNCLFRILSDEKFRFMTEVKAKENRHRVLYACLRADAESRRLLITHFLPLIRLWKSADLFCDKRNKAAGKKQTPDGQHHKNTPAPT